MVIMNLLVLIFIVMFGFLLLGEWLSLVCIGVFVLGLVGVVVLVGIGLVLVDVLVIVGVLVVMGVVVSYGFVVIFMCMCVGGILFIVMVIGS